MVTICTAILSFNNSTFSPRSVFMCFLWIRKQTAVISLYSINWLDFITEIKPFTAQCSLYVRQIYLSTILRSAHTVYLCVLFGSENKQRLFPYKALTDWIFKQKLNTLVLCVQSMYRHFNIQQFYVQPTQCIYVFCLCLRTNSDYFPIKH